eukprot:gene14705-20745_t
MSSQSQGLSLVPHWVNSVHQGSKPQESPAYRHPYNTPINHSNCPSSQPLLGLSWFPIGPASATMRNRGAVVVALPFLGFNRRRALA